MNIEQYTVDVIVQKLNECEQLLSDEAYAFLDSFEDIEDIMVYQNALVDYAKLIEDRFWCDEEDEQDEVLIKNMLLLINTLINAMIDADDDIIVIDSFDRD